MRDLLVDAWHTVVRRPWRASLTVTGVALGIGALVGITALAESGSVQIIRRFDPFAATAVLVTVPPGSWDLRETELRGSLEQIPGVRAAGTVVDASPRPAPSVSSAHVARPGTVPLVVASPAGLHALDPRVIAGVLPTATACSLDARLAVVGTGVAGSLDVAPEAGRDVLFIQGQPFVVVGVVRDRSGARLAGAVSICPQGARALALPLWERTLMIRTAPGAGQTVARLAPLALLPQDPRAVSAQVAPDPRRLRDRISSDTRALLLTLAAVALAVGAVGIANAMLVSVLERRSEIGIRRALGATATEVGVLFLAEALIVGTLGGVVGATLGVLASAGICALWGWLFVFPAALVWSPLLGTAVGGLAGLAPAVRASRLDPIEPLRSL